MKLDLNRFLPILSYLGALFWIFGFIVLTPIVFIPLYEGEPVRLATITPFLIPSLISLVLGALFRKTLKFRPLSGKDALMVCALGWVLISALGAIPFVLGLGMDYLNAYFESMSGFTTTGITMLTGLDMMPHSILFWRALTQWIGGLGILTLFLVLVFTGGASHQLFRAESHKIFSKRPSPGMFNTLKILWSIYSLFTGGIVLLLLMGGVPLFDAIYHAFTALSTGGYSPHDASVDYFRLAGFQNYQLIEYTLILAMILGGMSFFVHYRILRGEIHALWEGLEIRLWWKLILVSVILVIISHLVKIGSKDLADLIRYSLFQVVAILTTTGFATKDISSSFFPALAKQVFLILMVIGGCVGSTSGGIKVLRIGILSKMVGKQVQKIVTPRRAVSPLIIDDETVDLEEIRRIAALFFAWIALLILGGAVTALFSDLGPFASFSGMFSALGNIGPCYISVRELINLHPLVKITYIVGMLAGRLEILPVILLFSRRTWR